MLVRSGALVNLRFRFVESECCRALREAAQNRLRGAVSCRGSDIQRDLHLCRGQRMQLVDDLFSDLARLGARSRGIKLHSVSDCEEFIPRMALLTFGTTRRLGFPPW